MKAHVLGAVVVFLFVICAVAAAPAGAQAIAAIQVAARQRAAGRQTVRAPAVLDTARRKPPRWPFVLVGAVAGGVAAGTWYAHATAKEGDPMLHVGAPVVVVGACVGALTGWVLGEVVRHARAGAPAT